MMLARLVLLVFCSWLVIEIAATQSLPPDYCAPIWKQEILEDLHSNRPERFTPTGGFGVVFLNDQELIVYALEPSGQLSSRRSHEISSAFRQRVRIVDVLSGNTRLTKDFNARPHGSTVQVTTGGVLVNTGEIVKLYSADFATNQNLTVPPADEGDMSITSVSPTGKTIMINHFNPKRNMSHLHNVRFVKLNNVSLSEFGENSFDLVYSVNVFAHLDEMDRWSYIQEAIRVLRPGGRVYVDNIDLESDLGWHMFADSARRYRTIERPPYMPRFSTAAELSAYAIRAGFQHVAAHWRSPLVIVIGAKSEL